MGNEGSRAVLDKVSSSVGGAGPPVTYFSITLKVDS